jgi:hypothetical protein
MAFDCGRPPARPTGPPASAAGCRVTYTVTNRGGDTPATQSTWDDLIYLSRDRFLDLRADRFLDRRASLRQHQAGRRARRTNGCQTSVTPFTKTGRKNLLERRDRLPNGHLTPH